MATQKTYSEDQVIDLLREAWVSGLYAADPDSHIHDFWETRESDIESILKECDSRKSVNA